MMNGGVAELACRNRLRSRDMNGNNKEEEKGKMHYYEEEEDEDGDEEEEEETRGSVKKVQNRKASTAILEKENGKKTTIDLSDDDEKEDVVKLDKQVKNKDEKMMMHGGDDKMKYRMAHTTTSEKEKKKKSVSSHGHAKKMQNGDHDKDKRGNTARPLDKSKDSLKEKSRKMPSSHSGKKKMPSGDHHKEKKSMPSNSKHFGKEKRKSLGSDNKEKRTWYDYGEHKGNNNVMQKNEMKKKMWPNDRTGKKLRTNDKDEKAGSGDRWKTKKRTMEGYTKEQKVPSCHKEKRNVSIAFFKLIYNNFEKFLLLPPVVAPKLTDLTNRSVNLKDSEGKFSEVRLSVVDGSLAFHQGWNDFVSDHSIKLGDFLLFEYTARSQFSVRVFGMDSCERVCFSVERQGGMKRKGCPEPDETGNVAKYMNAVSGARCVAINSKEDPNRVVSGVEHGTSIELYDKDANLADGKLKASDIFQTCSKGIRSSKIIVITDEDPLTQENEHTEKLKTNCISSICSTEKITRSEIIPVVEAAPLAEENDDAVKLTTFPLHIKGTTSMMKKSEPEIATPTECTKIDDSDEDLRSKQEGNTVRLECTTSVDKCPNNSKINTNRNVCSKDEAPGGSESLEKKAPVSGRAALDGTGLIKPEKILKTEEKLVGHCTSMGVNSFEQSFQGYAGRAALDGTGLITPLAQECDDAVKLTTFPLHIEDTSTMKKSEPEIATPTKYTEMHDSDEDLRRKQEGNTVQLQCTTSVDKFRNNSKMNTSRNVCSKYVAPGGSQSLEKKAPVSGRAALDGTGLIKPEKILKTEEKLVGHCTSMGVNSFEQSFQGYAGRAALDGTGLITPLAQECDDAVKLTTFPLHIEDTSTMKKSEPEIATPTKYTEMHDSDEDLRRKQEGNTVQLQCTTSVDKFRNNSKMNTSRNVCSKYVAPGGSQSLEKKAPVSGRAALDGTGLITPEKLLKAEDKLVVNCSSTGANSFEQSLRGYAGGAALDCTGLIRPEKRMKTEDELVGKCGAMGVNPVGQSLRGYAGTHSCVQQAPGKISKSGHIKTEVDHFVKGKGPIVQPKTEMKQFETMGNITCRQQMNNIPASVDHAAARLSEHRFFKQDDRKSSHHETPAALLPVKVEVLEDDHSVLKDNLKFSIPPTTQTWLELPTSLSNAVCRKGRQDRNVVMLKDPMKRLWPVFYHENSVFLGFTRGWKPFVAANNLQTGDVCELLKDLDEDELVYHVRFTRK